MQADTETPQKEGEIALVTSDGTAFVAPEGVTFPKELTGKMVLITDRVEEVKVGNVPADAVQPMAEPIAEPQALQATAPAPEPIAVTPSPVINSGVPNANGSAPMTLTCYLTPPQQ
jgi:hypothetical protein